MAALAVPTGAAGASCPEPPPATYESGGPPRSGFPDDPLFGRQWNLRQINAPAAWARGARGAGVTIAVVDSGVDHEHPDLSSKLVPGVDLAEGGLGQRPDCPPGPDDEDGHGTRVAGIAAAATGNGQGIAGVAPDAAIMPITYIPGTGIATRDSIAAGIRWAADRGARVINTGTIWGRSRDARFAGVLDAAVDYAWARGAVVVAPVGTGRLPPSVPAEPTCSMPAARAICVAAVDRNGLPTIYSHLPIHPRGGVAFRAPGGALEETPGACGRDDLIWSTKLPGGPGWCSGIEAYDQRGATSWAAPHVAGAAAILAGMGLDSAEIVDCLIRTASNGGRSDPLMGYGIPNLDVATRDCGAS